MDATEVELDAKLYKASGALLREIGHKLPLLIFNPKKKRRLRVIDSKCEELRSLLDRFQEWPQLLDQSLSSYVQLLSDAFVGYITTSSQHYAPSFKYGIATVSPLPRAICRLLYTLCKVRGYKVIVRLLNNEPRFLIPMLSCFKAWNTSSNGMIWEERYIMMLWLSHLMLAPFELATISTSDSHPLDPELSQAFGDLPGIAGDITAIAFPQLQISGKEREAAGILLVRLCLRKDMQDNDLHLRLVHFATQQLLADVDLTFVSPYRGLGLMTLLYGIINSGSDSEVAPFLKQLFDATFKIATDPRSHYLAIRDSAPARKLILKILRVILTHAISISSSGGSMPQVYLTSMLEESIQYFLDSLGDKDTPVRMSAAKALGVVALKLDPEMSGEVIEAVLACLQENVLLEDPHTHSLVPATEKTASEVGELKKNLSAVDPLRWHGLMLTLAHLLYRRSPPPELLPEIVEALVLGLDFEQRSNVGTSVGVGVRDAACFGLWALARKYSTAQLSQVDISRFAEARNGDYTECQSVLQMIAARLTISACFDPSGNIRRASSAALQELIGRHPDTILHGIPLVQVVDYHAVARLSRAMIEVSAQAAALDTIYHRTLLSALLGWRGSRATDTNQRRWAASTMRVLAGDLSKEDALSFADMIVRQLLDLKPFNIGSTAGSRHGLLLALTAVLETLTEREHLAVASWILKDANPVLNMNDLTGKMDARVTADLELVMEAISALIGAVCKCLSASAAEHESWISSALALLDQCTVTCTKDAVIEASANATVELFKVLSPDRGLAVVEDWLNARKQPVSAFKSKGRIKTLGMIYAYLALHDVQHGLQQKIVEYITTLIKQGNRIETRVAAMEAFGVILLDMEATVSTKFDVTSISETLYCGLTDYTNDQRGDIGSLLRLQSLEAVDALRSNEEISQISNRVMETVIPVVVKLAAEKLNSVRFRAWRCLYGFWQTHAAAMPKLTGTFEYPQEVSTEPYYQQLMKLLLLEWLREPLVLGLVSSATSGTEVICRAASNALVWYMQGLDEGKRDSLSSLVSSIVLKQLAIDEAQDDRQVVPLLDFLCFMMDQGLFAEQSTADSPQGPGYVWTILQHVLGQSPSLQRIEASLNLCSRLVASKDYRTRALDKLTRQLLHRWPKVRNTAADLLYLETCSPILASCDWNAPVSKTKAVVLELRKSLGVAGFNATKT
ncbi:hypothetical protein ABEF95_001024 [Exophiala dermatitidis]|uniref:Uncharacterized protein n=2 Tax=Exophiala dermatitidis TaxID=5970 RepID=H6BLE4_EXODN|nr:uncharacterized protein HMPREF1120_01044 [Exophiala dermatitidis NIH/UT8656]KAJ4507856.1 hypothetical protein HRR75_006566 [Exophiala dermatitidis]EHY52837.1 hypothetical protein HMPREF1120_01044 [Exophiala dermatitidis NIH/UT8656]KAJ4509997.1 hypothetical protein HRR74_007149 [Exophiala dermatitidis]KAJ4539442.1 hypothetical protein HRR77_006328 [Exophiala dermatitidis]KAJ4542771.1 hypothetical protein HRR78_006860 [Exophiala dermatitidis]